MMISPRRSLLGGAVALTFFACALAPAFAQTARDAELHQQMEEAHRAGRYEVALPFAQQLLASAEQQLPPDDPRLAAVIFEVANIYRLSARAEESLVLFRRALAIREHAFGPDAPQVGQVLIAIGVTSSDDGRYAEAEQVYKRAIGIAEKTGNQFNIAAALHDLSMTYYAEGRYADAIPLAERSLAEMSRARKSDDVDVATQLHRLGLLYHAVGRDAEAEPLLNRALAIHQKLLQRNGASFDTEHGVAAALAAVALLDRDRGRFDEAERLYLQDLDLQQKWVGPDHGSLVTDLMDLAVLYRKAGKAAEAELIYKRALAICEKSFSASNADTARITNDLIALYAGQGRYADAMLLVRDGIGSGTATIEAALPALYGARTSGLIASDQALDDSLNVVQRGKESATGAAVKALNARLASGNGRLAELVRNDQDLAAEAKSLDSRLLAAVGARAKRDVGAEKTMRSRLAVIAQQQAQLARIFATEFPDYAALSHPSPLTVHDVQALLTGDEAVVVTAFGAKSYVWAISRERAEWKELGISAEDIAKQVSALRKQLDIDHPKPFDPVASHALYRSVLGPIEEVFRAKKRISFVLDGALTGLPPQLLVVSDPTGKDLKQVDWLIRHQAVTVLPSVGSLKALRGTIRISAASKPMIGFADPLFNADPQRTARGLVGSVTASRGIKDTVANLATIKNVLPQLPDTADELRRVGASVQANSADLFFGRDASETRVKQSTLDQYRIVYFATHGLLAGDVKNFTRLNAEPALVLSLPSEPTTLDDGLLTASEVAQLKLNAEWVVLSACNTASGEKPGAEALSGLARAFFYAGGRSLLVSNWVVDSESTVALMTATFAAVRDPKLSHAEALQKAMLAMIDSSQRADWADPKYWAPFMVVGEPAKPI